MHHDTSHITHDRYAGLKDFGRELAAFIAMGLFLAAIVGAGIAATPVRLPV